MNNGKQIPEIPDSSVSLKNERLERKLKLKRFALFSIFVAIVLLLNFTSLGFINLGIIKATTVHIPVIIAGALMGPRAAFLMGMIFGISSLITNSFFPTLLSFAFSPFIPVPGSESGSAYAVLICFIPRLLCALIPSLINRAILKRRQKKGVKISTPSSAVRGFFIGALGSFINTALVMSMIYLFFGDALALAKNVGRDAVIYIVLGIVSANGIPELLVSGLFCAAALPVLEPIFLKMFTLMPAALPSEEIR